MPKWQTLADVKRQADGAALISLEENKYLFSDAIVVDSATNNVSIPNLQGYVSSSGATSNFVVPSLTVKWAGLGQTTSVDIGNPIINHPNSINFIAPDGSSGSRIEFFNGSMNFYTTFLSHSGFGGGTCYFYGTINAANGISCESDLGNKKIIYLADPEDAQDAATKNYVDTQGFITSESDPAFTSWYNSGSPTFVPHASISLQISSYDFGGGGEFFPLIRATSSVSSRIIMFDESVLIRQYENGSPNPAIYFSDFTDGNVGFFYYNAPTNSFVFNNPLSVPGITSTSTFASNGVLSLGIDAATNTAGVLKFWSAGSNDYYTTFTAATQTSSAAYTLPVSSANGLLSNTGGVLSWSSAYATTASLSSYMPLVGASLNSNLHLSTVTNYGDAHLFSVVLPLSSVSSSGIGINAPWISDSALTVRSPYSWYCGFESGVLYPATVSNQNLNEDWEISESNPCSGLYHASSPSLVDRDDNYYADLFLPDGPDGELYFWYYWTGDDDTADVLVSGNPQSAITVKDAWTLGSVSLGGGGAGYSGLKFRVTGLDGGADVQLLLDDIFFVPSIQKPAIHSLGSIVLQPISQPSYPFEGETYLDSSDSKVYTYANSSWHAHY